MSLRGRLVAASLVLLAASLLVADAATFVALRSFLDNQVDQQLKEAVESVERSPYFGGDRGASPAGASPSGVIDGGSRGGPRGREDHTFNPQAYTTAPGAWIQQRGSDGTVLAEYGGSASAQTRARPALPDPIPNPNQRADASVDDQGVKGITLTLAPVDAGGPTFRVRVSTTSAGATTIIALPLDNQGNTLRQLLVIELFVTISVMALSAAGGMWLVRLGLRPLDDIEITAAHIAGGDLSRRVERADERTEVGRLGMSLNNMLGQIETAFVERQASEDALRESEGRLRRFVADASHELRTPLAAVSAYAELFDRAGADHPEDLPRMMHNIQKEAARMGVLVEDLLLLTRLDQGRPLERQAVDLGAIAAEAVEAARVVDPERPISLVVDGSIEVRGDRTRLRQIVDNLVGNARVHTPPGTAVEVVVQDAAGFGELLVVDHGPGLSAEHASRIFERFYRADPSRSRADGGSGLGLSIVAAIAAAHGGEASMTPTAGGGATFVVRVPLLADGPPPVA